MKRSPLARRTPLRAARTPLAAARRLQPRSKKATGNAETRRDVLTIVHQRDGWRCQAERVWPETPCGGRLDGHEPLPRSRGGNPLDPDQVITCCRSHHSAIHDNPRLARERGLTR